MLKCSIDTVTGGDTLYGNCCKKQFYLVLKVQLHQTYQLGAV